MNDLPLAAPLSSNLPEYTVSELSLALKRSIEDSFSHVRVRGEISGFKRHGSGHCYLALKDADAVLDAVCWRQTAIRLPLKPEDGMEVVCTGRLTTYPGRSKYQLVIDTIELAGIGALLRILEEKGHIRHQADGPRYVFSPLVPRDRARRSALKHLLQTFFDNSATEAVAALLDAKKLTPEELDRIEALIKERKT